MMLLSCSSIRARSAAETCHVTPALADVTHSDELRGQVILNAHTDDDVEA
jgi:hypothetical protein